MKYNNGNASSSSSSGIGFLGLLAVVFITLKLTDHIDWSWWWVLSPLWMPITLGIVILLGVLTYAWRNDVNDKKAIELNKEKLRKLMEDEK